MGASFSAHEEMNIETWFQQESGNQSKAYYVYIENWTKYNRQARQQKENFLILWNIFK